MFESAGFEVIDLGVDVPIERFIEVVKENKDATIVALSALLTTTMPSLRDTVAALLKQPFRPRIKIMVGGAPISQEFADEIGADAYTEDAASAAEQAKKYADSGFCAKAAAGEFPDVEVAEEEAPAEENEEEAPAVHVEKPLEVKFDKSAVDISKVKLPGPGEGYKLNWEETKEKFTNYWQHKNTGRPLMCVIARRPEVEQFSDGTPVEAAIWIRSARVNITTCRKNCTGKIWKISTRMQSVS